MNDRNYSKELRKYIMKCYTLLSVYLKTENNKELIDGLKFSYNSTFSNSQYLEVITANKIVTIDDIKRIKPMTIFSIVQMYTDYYRYLKHQDVTEGTNYTNYLTFDSFEEVLWFLNQEDMLNEFYDSMIEYKTSTTLDKILLEKCLEEKEKQRLLKINPFYEYEMNKYNPDVTLKLITGQIRKWQEHYPNNIRSSYRQTANFLSELYKTKPQETSIVIKQIMNKIGNVQIENYCIDTDSYMSINEKQIDEFLLEGLLTDYYNKEKEKKLIKN